jgi:hypothetical protein
MKRSYKKAIIALSSLVIFTVMTSAVLSVSNSSYSKESNDLYSPLQVDETIAIPITNHITNNQNIGSF